MRRMQPMHPDQEPDRSEKRHGFTLIELLLSISIFAVVLVAANGILFGVLRLRNKTMDRLAKSAVFERATGVIIKDLSGIMLPNGKLSGSLQSENDSLDVNQGKAIGPIFYTNTGLIDERSPWSEIQKVAYYLRPPTNFVSNGGLDLIRTVTRNLLSPMQEQPEDQWLLGGVETLVFSYYDANQWRSLWNSTNEVSVLPKAIKVEILLVQENTEQPRNLTQQMQSLQLVVPLLVAAQTNLTQTTETQL